MARFTLNETAGKGDTIRYRVWDTQRKKFVQRKFVATTAAEVMAASKADWETLSKGAANRLLNKLNAKYP